MVGLDRGPSTGFFFQVLLVMVLRKAREKIFHGIFKDGSDGPSTCYTLYPLAIGA